MRFACLGYCASYSRLLWHRQHICRLWRGERHLLRHCRAMLLSQVAIHFHGQRSAVAVTKPAGYRWNVHAGLYASGSEQVAQIMVRNFRDAYHLASSREGLLTLANLAYRLRWFRVAEPQPLKQLAQVRDDRDAAGWIPVPRAPHFGVVNSQEARLHVHVAPGCGPRFG